MCGNILIVWRYTTFIVIQTHLGNTILNFGLIVIDMQNGFVSRGGSYDRLGMNIQNYRHIIPSIQEFIRFCRKQGIPVFYTKAIREPRGIDLLINDHIVLPRAREEGLEKFPICVRGTWDADIIDDIQPSYEDHIIIKR
jgi:ureidoacrylate peracid hydrolase